MSCYPATGTSCFLLELVDLHCIDLIFKKNGVPKENGIFSRVVNLVQRH